MSAPYPLPPIVAAITTLLKTDPALAAILAPVPSWYGTGPGVYPESGVPSGAAFPYVTVGAPTELPFNRFGAGAGGGNCTIQVKSFSKTTTDDQGYAIQAEIRRLLDIDNEFDVAGFGSASSEFELSPDLLVENVGGVIVRQIPVIYRVYAHE